MLHKPIEYTVKLGYEILTTTVLYVKKTFQSPAHTSLEISSQWKWCQLLSLAPVKAHRTSQAPSTEGQEGL